ncbi:glycosyltransferase family 4 protein [Flavobacterium sasangense]|uniref:glycosyltransferase family 4 protein n=1 Tax=Flavobacterium sasangense TaxID=503361 RepID=UPI00047ACD85|nr:glycosyltransferase family 4 protein [Flavobacterium sasangense]
MKNVLFVHQSAELYGSDRTLLLLMKHINKQKFHPIVVLPNEGPLKIELEKEKIEVHIAPVIKLHRKMFKPQSFIGFLKQLKQGFSILNHLNEIHQFDLIYSNTLAVLLGFIYARKKGMKHIWHVHEIVESPKIVSKVFRFLLNRKSNFFTIYNSNATADFWNSFNNVVNYNSFCIIHNGLEMPKEDISYDEINLIRRDCFKVKEEIVIALVGRINRLKGHKLVLNAIEGLDKKLYKVLFIGSSVENQEFYIDDLKTIIKEKKLDNNVLFIPFNNQMDRIWKAVDIAVVPSTEPESFGLVAVEAMLAKKPVIASNHGGLTEIIKHKETGFLIEPNNVKELTNAIELLVNDKQLRTEMGEQGYLRAIEEFSIQKYVSKIEKVLLD